MNRKLIGFFIVGMLIVITVFPGVGVAIHKNDQKENTIALGSRLLGLGFVRINGFTHVIRGFVIFGINDGQFLSMEFIRIKFSEVNVIFAGYFSSLIFLIVYNPA